MDIYTGWVEIFHVLELSISVFCVSVFCLYIFIYMNALKNILHIAHFTKMVAQN